MQSPQDLVFLGGLLHKVNLPYSQPLNITETALGPTTIIKNYALGNISAFGLLDDLQNKRDVSVFSITNEAWDPIYAKHPSKEALAKALKDYVVTPALLYGNQFTGKTFKTLSGKTVTLTGFVEGTLKVNGVSVVEAQRDIFTINGVIQVLEK